MHEASCFGADHSCPKTLVDNVDLCHLVAAAADLCRKPYRHAVLLEGDVLPCDRNQFEITLRLEVRDDVGERIWHEDLELEIYRSGKDLSLMLSWLSDDDRPMLWHGSHSVWMDASGQRCSGPGYDASLEALARRLMTLLKNLASPSKM